MSVLLIALGIVLIACAQHPFITYPLTLRLLARYRPRPVRTGAPTGTVAFCLSVFNEERVIRAKVENMLAMRERTPQLEILVYVDGATDRTTDILREYEGRIHAEISTARMGKTHGMNRLVGMTTADIVVFSDANVIFAPDALQRLLAAFADENVGCACGHLIYTLPGDSATAATGSAYWRLEEHIKALESASGSVMGADGSIFALRRVLHRSPPPDLIDDMFISLSVLCEGKRIVRVGDAVAYEESVSRSQEEFRRKVRIACQAFNVHRELAPRLFRLHPVDIYKYVSHKLLRWLTIYLLAGGCAAIVAGIADAGAPRLAVLLVLLGYLGAGALGLLPIGPLPKLREVMSAFVATGIGVWRSLRGDRFQTWSPPASARNISSPAWPRQH